MSSGGEGVLFASERELAAYVREQLEARGWEVWPEVNGWDLYAQAGLDVTTHGAQPGDHLGIECKLRASWELLRQTLDGLPWRAGWYRSTDSRLRSPAPGEPGAYVLREPGGGPHWRAAIVPEICREAREVFEGLGVVPIEALSHPPKKKHRAEAERYPELRRRRMPLFVGLPSKLRFRPRRLPSIPELRVEVPAGVPSPRSYSAGKVAAVRTMLAVRKSPLTAREIADQFGGNAYSLASQGYLKPIGEPDLFGGSTISRGLKKYGPSVSNIGPPPDELYPEIVEALAAKGLT